MKNPLHLFDAFGVELEYMIVRADTLDILPICDKVIEAVAGNAVSDVEFGPIAWSNELALHVIEIKCNGPARELAGLAKSFQEHVRDINGILKPMNAKLLPGGAHPWMDPFRETKVWPHEYTEIYRQYDRIFDCRGHGWSNLQSTHLNLPFQGDDEFGRLHAAIRMILPILPALSASSPVLDGKISGFHDARLEVYRSNQKKIPSITGIVIPERAFTHAEYEDLIFERIREDIEPHDPEKILDQHFLNSRGAIARFDRGAIEIRIIDIQECPAADIAVLEAVVHVLRALISGDSEGQKKWKEDDLSAIFLDVIKGGENTLIQNPAYLRAFGLSEDAISAGALWRRLLAGADISYARELELILTRGSLSSRILNALGKEPARKKMEDVYRELGDCLNSGRQFLPA